MQPVEQEIQKLLGIMLRVSLEHWVNDSYLSLNSKGSVDILVLIPKFVHEASILVSQLSLRSQGIIHVNFIHKVSLKEIVCKKDAVG